MAPSLDKCREILIHCGRIKDSAIKELRKSEGINGSTDIAPISQKAFFAVTNFL